MPFEELDDEDRGQPVSPEEIPGTRLDPHRASAAGAYGAVWGSRDTNRHDRHVAAALAEIFGESEMRDVVQQNRAMQGRALATLAGEGHDQFLDIGPAHPAEPFLHEIVCRHRPNALFGYVDHEKVVVAHARVFLASPRVRAWEGDLRDIDTILNGPPFKSFLRANQPVVVVLGAILHFILDDQMVADIIAKLRQRLAVGSVVIITHATPDDIPEDKLARALEVYERNVVRLRLRTRRELADLLSECAMWGPGIAPTYAWRAEIEETMPLLDGPHLLSVVADLHAE
ncbi:SAM-dependent methyltransferase [Nonomuraea sp. NPDC050790]|uniref:SAM-dependent methyltransferase n=1 Tax=Nonomuraea sp. NPDC050790 TaxID=3364371 RepID=UPI00378D2C9A